MKPTDRPNVSVRREDVNPALGGVNARFTPEGEDFPNESRGKRIGK
jgi:hypothetical protein